MLVETSTEIRKSPEAVFDYLAHHPNHVNFIEQNVSCEQVSPGPMGVGTKLKNTAKLIGPFGRIEEHFEVVAFERPGLISKASREGSSLETTDAFALKATQNGTHLQLTVTATPRSFGQKIFLKLMKPMVTRVLRRSLEKLKTILEAS